jgi:tripartite-type tricarboxylate transporter receptor subunit TctC
MLLGKVRLLTIAIACLGVAAADVGYAQIRAIKFIVPFGAGSSIDILARLLAEEVGRVQATTVTVENRLGAGTIVATESVAGAPPDGSTVLFATTAFLINPQLRKVNYDPLNSFEPICHLTNQPNLFVVNAAAPYRTLGELIAAARAAPGTLTLASVGPGTGSHIAFENLKQQAGMNMTFVPYQGTPPAINALLGGHITAVLAGYGDVIEQIDAGTLRALAVASLSRIASMPALPTVVESGFKDYDASIWYGALLPAKTAPETVSRLGHWLTAAMQAPEMKTKLAGQSLNPVGACGADFTAFLRRQYDDYSRVIRAANMKVD